MSSNKDSGSNNEDIFSKLLREKDHQNNGNAVAPSAADNEAASSSAATINQQIIFLGDMGSGKSTLIQTFIKPNAVKENNKPTISLEYNFARKTVNNVKYVANLWEIGGDFLDSSYLEVPLTKDTLSSTTIFLVIDFSKPHNIIVSILRSLTFIREILKKRSNELKSVNVNAYNELKGRISSAFNGHSDERSIKPLDLPIVIIGNKYDMIKLSMPLAERRVLIQGIRFIAHYFGGIFLTVSNNDPAMKEIYRSLMNNLAFPTGNPLKPAYEIHLDKYVYITKGQDSFDNIFHGTDNETVDSKVFLLVLFFHFPLV
jgi:GTPase SAR1 family protein